MNVKTLWAVALAAGMPALWGGVAWSQDAPSAPLGIERSGEDVEGVETLVRGPLHEAFAEPVVLDRSEVTLIPKAPPEPIDEVPPEYKPDEESAVWISGYWAWDDERSDFLWVSGVWRVPPPDQRWMPGYWNQVDRGWQWVPGFWVAAQTEQLVYRDPPPASLEAGPSSPSPGDDYFYVPGYYNYYSTGYRWQPGYWNRGYNDWVWMPARWIYTPRGAYFCNGYWDRRLPYRGVVFASAYFRQPYWNQPGWNYRPSVVINVNSIFNHLFVRPGYGHYYYGDWYGNQYARNNYYPAYQWHTRRGCYDPLVSFYSSYYRRQGDDYMRWSRDWHDDMVRDTNHRPPRTWNDVQRYARDNDGPRGQGGRPNGSKDDIFAARLNDVALAKNNQLAFVKVDDRQQAQAKERSKEWKELTRQRNDNERGGGRENQGPTNTGRNENAFKLPKVDMGPQTAGSKPGKRDDVPKPIARINQDDGPAKNPGVVGGDRNPRVNQGPPDRGTPGRGGRPNIDTTQPKITGPQIVPGDKPKTGGNPDRTPRIDQNPDKGNPADNRPRLNPNPPDRGTPGRGGRPNIDTTPPKVIGPQIVPGDKPKTGGNPDFTPRGGRNNDPGKSGDNQPRINPNPPRVNQGPPDRTPRVKVDPPVVVPKSDSSPRKTDGGNGSAKSLGPRIERPQPQPQPRVEQQQFQPRVEQPKPQVQQQIQQRSREQPRQVERPQIQAQPRVERSQPRNNDGGKQANRGGDNKNEKRKRD